MVSDPGLAGRVCRAGALQLSITVRLPLLLELLCFLKIHGIVGCERWVAGTLPPALLALWAMRRRTHRFYRESIRRQNNQRHRAG